MPRSARLVVPGLPHHVTQRGSRRRKTFFSNQDYAAYLSMLKTRCSMEGVRLLSYCLMPNHVHLIVIPKTEGGLAKGIGQTHESYARRINRRENWTGHLWQSRFFSCPMEATHVVSAVRYVLMNPVRAGLCEHPLDWPHSSAFEHLNPALCQTVESRGLEPFVHDWGSLLNVDRARDDEHLRRCTASGRPLGSARFVECLEGEVGRTLRFRPRGRPSKSAGCGLG